MFSKLFGLSNILKNFIPKSEVERSISISLIDETPDEKLASVIYDRLSPNMVTADYFPASFSESQKAIHLVFEMEGRINMDGFDLYYLNTQAEFLDILPAALRYIGAEKFALVLDEADARYRKLNLLKYVPDASSVEPPIDPFEEIYNKFRNTYEFEDLEKIQVNFIRANKAEFLI